MNELRDTILGLLPNGQAWKKGKGSDFFKISESLGNVVGETYSSTVDALPDLLSPIGSKILGNRWPDELGIPEDTDLDKRLAEAEEIYTQTNDFSQDRLIAIIAEESGKTPEVRVFWPSRPGLLRAGQRLRGPSYQFVIVVDNIAPTPIFRRKILKFIPSHVRVYLTNADGSLEALPWCGQGKAFSIEALRSLISRDNHPPESVKSFRVSLCGTTRAGQRVQGMRFANVIALEKVSLSPSLRSAVRAFVPGHMRIYLTDKDGIVEEIF